MKTANQVSEIMKNDMYKLNQLNEKQYQTIEQLQIDLEELKTQQSILVNDNRVKEKQIFILESRNAKLKRIADGQGVDYVYKHYAIAFGIGCAFMTLAALSATYKIWGLMIWN